MCDFTRGVISKSEADDELLQCLLNHRQLHYKISESLLIGVAFSIESAPASAFDAKTFYDQQDRSHY
jgi:hypothetical protein